MELRTEGGFKRGEDWRRLSRLLNDRLNYLSYEDARDEGAIFWTGRVNGGGLGCLPSLVTELTTAPMLVNFQELLPERFIFLRFAPRYYDKTEYRGALSPTMKEFRSRFLRIVSVGFLAFPLTYFLIETTLLDVPIKKALSHFFTWSFWFLAFLGIATGYGFKEMTRWSWNLFLFTSFVIAYSNAFVLMRYSHAQNKWMVFLACVSFQIFLIYRLGREIKVPYFLPKIRWWESNPRFKASIPVRFERERDGFSGDILDLSLGGCFIKTRSDLRQSERILVHFEIFGERFEVGGTVVWRSTSSVTHPKGVGVKFDVLLPTQKKVMKAVLAHLKKINQVQSSRAKMSPEEFSRKMHHLRNVQLNIVGSGNKETTKEVS